MQLNIKFQIAAFCFYLVALGQYLFSRRLPTRANRVMGFLFAAAGINLVFDFVTVAAVTYIDRIPLWLTRLAHQMFVGSLDLFVALLCLFVMLLISGGGTKWRRVYALVFVPFFASLLGVVFGGLDYYTDGYNVYSYGLMANTVYLSMGIYLLFTLSCLIWNRQSIAPRARNAIIIAIVGEAAIGLIQRSHPTLLISGLGISLMMTLVFNSLANPKEFTQTETGALNAYGFGTILKDSFASSRGAFDIIVVCIDNLPQLGAIFGADFKNRVVSEVCAQMETVSGRQPCYPREKCLCLIVPGHDGNASMAESICDSVDGTWSVDGARIKLSARTLVIRCPEFVGSYEQAYSAIDMFAENLGAVEAGGVLVFDEAYAAALRRRAAVETILKDAVENDGLRIVLQPIYSTTDRRCSSAEALVRIKDEHTIGYIPPDEFIAAAEKSGLIRELGRIVTEKVCRFIARPEFEQLGVEYIEVNLSALQCMDAGLTDELLEIMERCGVEPKRLNFEITESAALEESETMLKNIDRLLGAGASFSMDDYGTGYSNLAMMADMPYRIIKLDKSIIWPYFDDNASGGFRVVLPATVEMLKNLGVHIVAEGVETKLQLDALTAMGVDHMQGYYFSRPLPEDEFIEYIRSFSLTRAGV